MQLYTIMLVVITLLSTNTYIQADLSQICRDTFNSLANHLLGCSEKILSLTYMNQSWESCSNHQSIPLCFQSPCFLYSVRYWIASRACFYRWNGYWNNVSMRKSDTVSHDKKKGRLGGAQKGQYVSYRVFNLSLIIYIIQQWPWSTYKHACFLIILGSFTFYASWILIQARSLNSLCGDNEIRSRFCHPEFRSSSHQWTLSLIPTPTDQQAKDQTFMPITNQRHTNVMIATSVIKSSDNLSMLSNCIWLTMIVMLFKTYELEIERL